MSNKSFVNQNVKEELRGRVQLAAMPITPNDNRKGMIRRAATRLGLTYGRTRAFWYGLVARPSAVEADLIRLRTKHLGDLELALEEFDRALLKSADSNAQLSLDLGFGETGQNRNRATASGD